MPLKIQNYGDWEGDKSGGHHPPACTCVQCTEQRLRLEEERRAEEYDRRVAQSGQRGRQQSPRGQQPPLGRRPREQGQGRRRRGPSLRLLLIPLTVVAGLAGVFLYVIFVGFSATQGGGEPPAVAAMVPTEEPTEEPAVEPVENTRLPAPTAEPAFRPTRARPVQTVAVRSGASPTSVAPTPVVLPTLAITPEPAPTSTRRPYPTVRPIKPTPVPEYVAGTPLDAGEVEEWIVEFTNQERAKVGLPPFVHDPDISDIARAHSVNMVDTGKFSHDVSEKNPTDRALDAGYDCKAWDLSGTSYTFGLAENIAKHPRVLQWEHKNRWRPVIFDADSREMAHGLVRAWMNSPGHRRNILDADSRRIGVGVSIEESAKYGYRSETVWATQNFSGCK